MESTVSISLILVAGHHGQPPYPRVVPDAASGHATGHQIHEVAGDGGYQGPKLGNWVQGQGTWQLNMVRRDAAAEGFAVVPKRWIVECAFA